MNATSLLRKAAAVLAVTLFAGCASAPHGVKPDDEAGVATARVDPWERFNRAVFAFNETVDRAVIKPAAQGYQAVVPQWLRTGIGNMFGNLGDAWSVVNLTLQAKPKDALETGMRVAANTVFGIAGFFDVAEEMGLERRNEDFGQTLGHWGVASGPYLMLPLLGPSTLRDAAALAVDSKASPPQLAFGEVRDQNGARVLQVLDTRARLLSASRVLDDIALDKYTFLRDAYLARRRSQIYDGNPPEDEDPAPAAPK
ncbi:MAG: VacJ family lipoprotein [Burkholderiaceae bacterium]|jgi:phospholipid-binding lipoprotein MlaA|nr:VacJ family lipoprotein [Aquabacterium sp.]NUP84709.1 VacJ family lipoprotein [Burkholderiaceae bacterium]